MSNNSCSTGMSGFTTSSTLMIMLPDIVCHQFMKDLFICAFIFVGTSLFFFLIQAASQFNPGFKTESFLSSSAGWVTSSPATAAASTCWRRESSSISTSSEPAARRCSPSDASGTCSGIRTGATPSPPSEPQPAPGRAGQEEMERLSTLTQIEKRG